ncbi:MAG: TonB-dependent receptor plug domain-containing protein, partial [Limisphaerales bacterium]
MKKNPKPHPGSNQRKRACVAKFGPCVAGASLLLGGSVVAADKADILDKPLEEIMQYQVTSASKKPENLSDAAASIFVITDEDIRRSGVTSIPEALRLSPGVEVARQDSHTWAISSRGFNDEFANQLLVLIDGRSVYTPLFAGVYW